VIPSNVTFLSWPPTLEFTVAAVLRRIAAAAAILIVLQNAAPHTALAQTATKPQAVVTVLHTFTPDAAGNYPNGYRPDGGFILGNDGNFYGTTITGGAFSLGAIYRITPSGSFQLLHSFTGGADGGNPTGTLAKDASGAIYGTTQYASMPQSGAIFSTAFRITPDGVFTSFGYLGSRNNFVEQPSGLVYARDGNLYGTSLGTNENGGFLFSLTPDGVMTTIHTFTRMRTVQARATIRAPRDFS
jgi:uncharacterized repeat protein (TIGR03803 family)